VAGFCKCVKEISGSINVENFLLVSFSRKVSVVWS